MLTALGRMAAPGDQVELTGWTIEVTGIDRNAVTAIRLQPRVTAPSQ